MCLDGIQYVFQELYECPKTLKVLKIRVDKIKMLKVLDFIPLTLNFIRIDLGLRDCLD